jgi:hypothetical protein
MKTKRLIAISPILFIAGVFLSCKKSNDRKPDCRITTIAPVPTGSSYHITYNAEGKIRRLVFNSTLTNYEYNGNTVTATNEDSGSFRSRRIITLNEAGMAINVRTEQNISGTDWINDSYEYNGEELIRSTNTSSTGNKPSVTTYVWSGHNLVSGTVDSTTTVFDYYQDKPRTDGDYFSLIKTLLGYDIYRPKNLLRSIDGTVFEYDFDPDGKISTLTLNSGGNFTSLDYEYQCN